MTLLKFSKSSSPPESSSPLKVEAPLNVVLLCFKHMFIQQKVMFVFKVYNQLKGTNTCLLRKYIFIINFPKFTTCSLSHVTTITANNHVEFLIAAVVHVVSRPCAHDMVFYCFYIVSDNKAIVFYSCGLV